MDNDSIRPKVMLVEDDITSVRIMAESCKEHFTLIIATNARQALDNLEQQPDIILIDLGLPDINGTELVKLIKIKHDYTSIPIVITTSNRDPDTVDQLFNLGVSDYLTKPIHPRLLVSRLSALLELSEQRKILEELASKDPLTGLNNRRQFNAQLMKETSRMNREKSTLIFAILDIDNFKAINDTLGHQIGDQCLQLLAETLSQLVNRPSDLVARFGGEEFAVVLPNTELDGGMSLIETIRIAVKDAFEANSNLPNLTVSIGVCIKTPELGVDYDMLYKLADEQLYRAKEAGKDCVMNVTLTENIQQKANS